RGVREDRDRDEQGDQWETRHGHSVRDYWVRWTTWFVVERTRCACARAGNPLDRTDRLAWLSMKSSAEDTPVGRGQSPEGGAWPVPHCIRRTSTRSGARRNASASSSSPAWYGPGRTTDAISMSHVPASRSRVMLSSV